MAYQASLLVNVLVSSWRPEPEPIELTVEELNSGVPSFLQTGAAALAWWRIRSSDLHDTPAAQQLRQAYRLYTLESIRHGHDITRVVTLLRENDIEPIMVKGWAAAQLYPQPGLRPYADIDICVPAKDYARAKFLLRSEEVNVDLHQGFRAFGHRPWEELYERSQFLRVNGLEVRIPSAEDHLALLCFHFLREGAWRPLWLCDIAAALESRPPNFDWDVCFEKNGFAPEWLACAIVLAHHLLGARIDDVQERLLAKGPPRWFIPSVLKEWATPKMPRRHQTPMKNIWRAPARTLKGIPAHWPNGIEATITVNGPFNEMPRLPFQIGSCALRTIDFLRHKC